VPAFVVTFCKSCSLVVLRRPGLFGMLRLWRPAVRFTICHPWIR
jgi:hypothetical protein